MARKASAVGFGIGGGFGPFGLRISTRGAGARIGPFSAGGAWKRRRRRTSQRAKTYTHLGCTINHRSPETRDRCRQGIEVRASQESPFSVEEENAMRLLHAIEHTLTYLDKARAGLASDASLICVIAPPVLRLGWDGTSTEDDLLTISPFCLRSTASDMWLTESISEFRKIPDSDLLLFERSIAPGQLIVGGSAADVVYVSVCFGLATSGITHAEAEEILLDVARSLLDDVPTSRSFQIPRIRAHLSRPAP